MNPTKRSTYLLRVAALALLFSVAACDNDGDGDVDEADLLVGSWSLTGVTDTPTPGDTRDRIADFNATFASFMGTFTSSVTADRDGTMRLQLDRVDPLGTDVDITADYELDQNAGTLTLTVNPGTGPVAIPFAYEFVNDDELNLTTGAALMNAVFGTTLVGESTMTLERT
jgi:hypothetical protein